MLTDPNDRGDRPGSQTDYDLEVERDRRGAELDEITPLVAS